MNVWKKQTIRWHVEGKNVPVQTPNAKRIVIESKRFYGTLKMASGSRKQHPLTEDRKSSRTLLERLQRDEDKKRALGITEIDERRGRSVGDALDDYITFLSTKGNTTEYVRLCRQRLHKLFTLTKTKTLSELDTGIVFKTLSVHRKTISVETSNHYVQAIKSFTRWLVCEKQLPSDPMIGLRKMNADVDRRRVRRAFTESELETLLAVTRTNTKTFRGSDWQFTGSERVMLYRIAAHTGLRAREISSLTVSSFDLETKTVTVTASNTKNRQRAVLPLTDVLSNELEQWLPTRQGERVFAGDWITGRIAGKMLQRDIKKANIEAGNGRCLALPTDGGRAGGIS